MAFKKTFAPALIHVEKSTNTQTFLISSFIDAVVGVLTGREGVFGRRVSSTGMSFFHFFSLTPSKGSPPSTKTTTSTDTD